MSLLFDDHGNDKFIVNLFLIGGFHGGLWGGSLSADALGQGVVGLFRPVPVLVPVHGIITAADGSDLAAAKLLHFLLQGLDIGKTAVRRGVPAVHEAVDIDLFQTAAPCQLQKSIDVGDVAVDAAVRNEPHEMQGAVLFLAVGHCRLQLGNLKQVSVFDGLCNAGQLLINDAASAHVQVAHLGVAHLSVGKSYGKSGGVALDKGAFRHQFIQMRLFGHGNRVAFGFLPKPKAVHDHQYDRFSVHCPCSSNSVPKGSVSRLF